MSILDKVVAALTPPESDEDRANARALKLIRSAPLGWRWCSITIDKLTMHLPQSKSPLTQILAARA